MLAVEDGELDGFEKRHPDGVSSATILGFFAERGAALSEATLRKYVQLGLLPRSVRVGRKGKHQGSQGLYPATVVRQIQRIKRMLAASYTIEQIQKEFLFMRSDLGQLERTLERIFEQIGGVLRARKSAAYAKVVARQVQEARALSHDLLVRLGAIEDRLTAPSGAERLAAS